MSATGGPQIDAAARCRSAAHGDERAATCARAGPLRAGPLRAALAPGQACARGGRGGEHGPLTAGPSRRPPKPQAHAPAPPAAEGAGGVSGADACGHPVDARGSPTNARSPRGRTRPNSARSMRRPNITRDRSGKVHAATEDGFPEVYMLLTLHIDARRARMDQAAHPRAAERARGLGAARTARARSTTRTG